MRTTDTTKSSRRAFLRQTVAAGGAATVAAATGVAVADIEPRPDGVPQPSASAQKKGYHVTPHIDAYYRSAKL